MRRLMARAPAGAKIGTWEAGPGGAARRVTNSITVIAVAAASTTNASMTPCVIAVAWTTLLRMAAPRVLTEAGSPARAVAAP